MSSFLETVVYPIASHQVYTHKTTCPHQMYIYKMQWLTFGVSFTKSDIIFTMKNVWLVHPRLRVLQSRLRLRVTKFRPILLPKCPSHTNIKGVHYTHHFNAINSIERMMRIVWPSIASHFIDLNAAVFGSFYQYFICCLAYKMLSTKPIISLHEDRLANKQLAVQWTQYTLC